MSAVGQNSKMLLEDIWGIQPSLNANAFKIILELVSVDFSDFKIERVAAWVTNYLQFVNEADQLRNHLKGIAFHFLQGIPIQVRKQRKGISEGKWWKIKCA